MAALRTFVATSNAGKLAEMRAIFAGSRLELEVYPAYAAVEEGETSYADNALLKARALQSQLVSAGIGACVLADDSGLEVAALAGRPGVLSARYAGLEATWRERRAALLYEMRTFGDDRRDAQFVACMALLFSDGTSVVAAGSVSGTITTREIGENGFGYDPIFFYPPASRTFAELSAEVKNSCSHRGAAAANLLSRLAQHGH